MHASIRLLALFALLPPVAHAVCVATPPARPLHLVELYTSEGCSSCPPAEHWLSSLRASTTFVPLEFHVDYFDDQGWRDPFSDPRYTARQQRLAKRGTRDQVYTPQIVVDGRPWKTWPKGSPPAPADPAAGTLTLEVEAAGADLRAAMAISPVYLEALKTYEEFASSDQMFQAAVKQFRLRNLLGSKPMEALKRSVLHVGIVRNTRILEISATLPDPRTAHELAKSLAESTVALNRSLVSESDQELVQTIEQQERDMRGSLDAADRKWAQLAAREPVLQHLRT